MNQAEWQACADPGPMLEFLQIRLKVMAGTGRVVIDRRLQVSERKLRLFAVACCRRVWPALSDLRSRRAVVVAERYADGQCSREELRLARAAASIPFGAGNEVGAARSAVADDAYLAACDAHSYTYDPERKIEAKKEKAGLLRDIVGNPFSPVNVDAAWLQLNDALIPRLAGAIYEDRRLPEGSLNPDRLLILAEALEEAGCDHADMLNHCRQPGVHVRGCWVIDSLLAKS